MARKQNGFWSKALGVLGIVDDDQPEREEYSQYSSDNYGRPSTYRPQRTRTERSTTVPQRRIPEHSGYTPPRRSEPVAARRKPEPAPARPRPKTRFEAEDEFDTQQAPRQSRPAAATTRTVMLTLYNLRDANKVITALVNGNMIVVTLNTQDKDTTLRITDTLSGAVFALGATIRKASDNTYLLAPRTVNVKAAYDTDDRF